MEKQSSPVLQFLVPGANENRWSDLLATLIATDPTPMKVLLDVDFDTVRREAVSITDTRRSDRLDLLLERDGVSVGVVEVKVLSDLGVEQLNRYLAAFPGAERYCVLHMAHLPVNVGASGPWSSLSWEDVLSAYSRSEHPWVRATAAAWLPALDGLVPIVGPDTVWNDVPDDAAGMELALRARVAWLANRMDHWCDQPHDLVQSSGGGSWAVRIWSKTTTPRHFVTVELQEGLSAFEWRPDPKRAYRDRLPGPVMLLGLRQEDIETSADFDWGLLHHMFATHVLDGAGKPRDGRAWQTTAASPRHPVDKQNWQSIVAAGAPRWLGKGYGMKGAEVNRTCVFGARFGLSASSTLAQIDDELRRVAVVVATMGSSSA